MMWNKIQLRHVAYTSAMEWRKMVLLMMMYDDV